MPTFKSPAVAQAVPTHDASTRLALAPALVASVLQRLLSDLVSQGYEVLCVTPIPGALLCSAIKRPEPPGVRWYGCEGITCKVGSHTLDCPHIDQP